MSIHQRLKDRNIQLPDVTVPAAAYVPYVQSGQLVFVSGHIAKKDGKPWVGQLGTNMDTETGRQAAESIAIDLLGTLQAACGGDLQRIKRIVKVVSLVNASGSFTEPHLVTNGCSEMLMHILGDAGAHARSAYCVAQLPMGSCVEIELVAEID